MKVSDIARAFHCSPERAKRLILGNQPGYRAIMQYGPMRCYWKYGAGWVLDGKPMRLSSIGSKRFWNG